MNFSKKGASDKQKALTSHKRMVSKKISVTFFKAFFVSLIAIAIIGICAGFGVVHGIIESAPDISNIDVSPTGFSTSIYDSNGNEITKLVSSGSNRIYVEIEEIPKHLQQAFVAIEDERFYEHNGIDIKGIIRAGVVGITSGDFSEGASTITQQLLKNNVFQNWTTQKYFPEKVKRKIQEQYLAVQLEQTMDKEVILENYLNTINLGQNTLGVQAASKRYFNKDVSELTLSESAVIAAITQNPSRYNPVTHPEENEKRRAKVLKNMLKAEYISREAYDEAIADDVYLRIQNVNDETVTSSAYTYFVDELIEQIMEDLQEQKGYSQTQAYNALYSGGLSIYTTQDMSIQQICDEEFGNSANFPSGSKVSLTYRLSVTHEDGSVSHYSEKTMLEKFKESDISYSLIFSSEEAAAKEIERYKATILSSSDTYTENITYTPQPQASCVVMDQATGYVKAIVGGRGSKEASLTLNRATNTTRQPGSTFKPLAAYAPALDKCGMTLATVFDDEPYNYSTGRAVSNYYSGYWGLNTIRHAIQESMNIIAVKTLTEITPKLGFEYLKSFGFSTLIDSRTLENGDIVSDIQQPLALGGITDGVTNLELTAAYATIANNGTYTKPIFYTKIVDHDGNVLIDNTPQTHTVLKESTAFLLTDALQDVVKYGTGGAVRFDGDMPIAGKTGTTSSTYDVWFAGFTPYYTCTVWGGYDINTSMSNASYHKVLWKKIMGRIHENLEVKEFSVPASIEKATICTKSGKLAVNGVCDHDPRGSMVREEYFAKGTVPTEVCDRHVAISICNASGKAANDGCPSSERSTKVFIVRPEGAVGTTSDTPYCIPSGFTSDTCTVHSAKKKE